MASFGTTVTRTVTLAQGEKFVLPPGAVLKGSTDNNAFTSTCPIPTLETLACYVAIFGSNIKEGDYGYFEGDQAYIIGYRLNGVETIFTEPFRGSKPSGFFDLDGLGLAMKTSMPGIIQTDGGIHGDGSRGQLNYLLIQTIASVATKLELIFQGGAPLDVEPQGNTTAISYVPFRTRASVITAGYEEVPACPVIEPED